MSRFQLSISDWWWIDESKDDPEDLCLHGDITAIIGDETINECCTVSASALYLLKSLTEDHVIGNQVIQIFPCCGFAIYADEEMANVIIIGCSHGTDLQITHDGSDIHIVTESGGETVIPFEEYQLEVFRFADQVKAIYDSCSPKVLPDDVIDRNGYITFWKEWERRRGTTV